jgi:hypothetical protein
VRPQDMDRCTVILNLELVSQPSGLYLLIQAFGKETKEKEKEKESRE